jgi:hypothetical protein
VPDKLLEEATRLRDTLVQGLTADVARAAGVAMPTPHLPDASPGEPIDFSPYRRAYIAHQRAMEFGIAGLRVKLRAALSAHSPDLARLSALDGALEGALRTQERQLLATVPDLLERHFERQQQAQPGQRPAQFAADMQAVLLAELALRWQAIEGLLATLSLETSGQP